MALGVRTCNGLKRKVKLDTLTCDYRRRKRGGSEGTCPDKDLAVHGGIAPPQGSPHTG